MIKRPRRLRSDENIRKMVRETRVDKSALIYPIFVKDGTGICEEIPSMEGQYRYSVDRLSFALEDIAESGVSSVMLFGIPEHKDEKASQAYAEDGIIQRALREAKKSFPKLYYITDVCLCEYTSHGHCGMLCGREVDNDSTLEVLAKTALSHVRAGADMVAPSDMMDGRVAAIRRILDENQFTNQMDYHNSREGIKEVLLDEEEGADIIMVKPALAYLDMIVKVKEVTHLPVAGYSVSGEYAMIKAAAAKGWIDEKSIVCETAVAAFRAGIQSYLTYYAKELAGYMDDGLIG